VAALLLALMVWSFGSSAANRIPPPANTYTESNQSGAAPQGDEDESVDADLGKFGSKIDRDTYLRLRGEYLGRKRGIEPGRPFDPELRSRALAQMDRQEKGRRLESMVNGGLTPSLGTDAGGAWTSIGPTSITNGQALSGGDTAVSGRVTAIVVDPSNASNVYLGTAQGGVWRSQDGGTTWAAIFDSADSLAIGALALAPSDPTILYVGTGEFNGCQDCFFGAGLYRIDTVTTTPSLVGPINPQETIGGLTYKVFNGRGITKIVVDPNNAGTIFVATGRGVGGSGGNSLSNSLPPLGTRGVYRSTNATLVATSVTFQKLGVTTDSSFDNPGTGNVDTTDIVMEPGNSNNLLVAVIGATAPGGTSLGGIYRTTNALSGTPTFTQVQVLPINVRANLAINKVGSVVTAYAATGETPLTPGGPTCTTGTGAVRKAVDPFNGIGAWSPQLVGGGGFCGSQCFYDIAIAVNPNDASEVYLGGNARSTCSDGMKKSTDGGVTFSGPASGSPAIPRDDNGLHADTHALVYDAAGTTIFVGNDGGVWKRKSTPAAGDPTGPGSAGTAWTNLNTAPLNTLQFESIAVHPTDRFIMIGGTQDNGTEYQQTSAGNWRNAEGGDGGYCLIDQSATDTTNVTMYHTFFNQKGNQIGFDRAVNTTCLPNKDFWPTRGIGFVSGGDAEQTSLSCDGTANYLHNGMTLTDDVLFYAPMALGPGAPNTLYYGSDRLYRSTDRGDHMTVVSQAPITGGSPISSIAIWPGGDNVRMVGLQNGQVWATSAGASSLVNITSGSFPTNPNGSTSNKFVGRAVIDPNNKNVGYVTFSFFAPAGQGIWKISNLVAAAAPGAPAGTAVWTAAGNGIPSIPINGLVIDPLNSNNLYAGTDIGVYSSTDGGANWAPFGTGLPRSSVFDLQIQPSFRLLRAATHGRGVWETALISPGASTVQFSAGASSVNEGQVSTTVTVTRSGDTSFPASVNYATADTGSNNCAVTINGSASSRCDYIATSGTLNFAANETSKNILIPIVDDAYLEGPETFTLNLSAAGGSNVTLSSPAMITITINDNETGSNGTNQIDTSNFFVREHYIDFLNREPDASGLNFWTNNINNCTPQPSCTDVQRINTSAAFFLSIEFQDTGYLVYRIYKAAYGDASGTSTLGGTHPISVPVIRLNEFLPDTQRIGQGVVVGQGNWQQQIDDNKTAFAEEFVKRARFLTDYPLTLTPTEFVDKLNLRAATAGVMPLSAAQHDQLVSDLTAGIKTRAQVLRAVAENQTLASAEKNRAFVLMQFFGYLRRNPDDPQDTNYTGYDFWLGKLNQFNGNFENAEMVKAFITSSEYRQRFGG
jgi:hypothetical protein